MAEGYNDRLTQGVWRGTCGKPEVEDDKSVVREKCAVLAEWIAGCNRLVVHSGAGISTSAGIRDFRGPRGVWTEEMKAAKAGSKRPKVQLDGTVTKRRKTARVQEPKEEEADSQGQSCAVGDRRKDVPMAEARPTFTHRALVALLPTKLHYIVSQNVDCLHRRSGVPRERLSELHGNICMELCDDCGEEYIRNFEIETLSRHKTGRVCDKCGGVLRDCLLDWNDELDDSIFSRAHEECSVADLNICIGTSMQMSPASDLPFLSRKLHRAARTAKKKAKGQEQGVARAGAEAAPKVVIVNLQKTSKDYRADLVIHAKCDDVFRIVMAKLGIAVRENDAK